MFRSNRLSRSPSRSGGERFAERIGAAFWQVRNFGEAFFVGYELVSIGRIGSLVDRACFAGFVVCAFLCVPQCFTELLAFFCLIRINRGLAVSHSSVILNDYGRGCLVLSLLFLVSFALPRAQMNSTPAMGAPVCASTFVISMPVGSSSIETPVHTTSSVSFSHVSVTWWCFVSVLYPSGEGFDYDVFRCA